MKSQRLGAGSVPFSAMFLCSAAWLALCGQGWAEINFPGSDSTPAGLVNAALRSEFKGPSVARKSLLDEALKLDPDFAPARWQLGFVRLNDQWLTQDEAAARAKNDPALAAYRKLREQLIDTADNHREMAVWCRRNKLSSEERVHWAKVLEFEPNDAEALAALGLQLYDGRLLTHQQIEQAKKNAGEQLRATRHWQPKIVKWRAALEHGTPTELDNALRDLNDLSDPRALPALEAVFSVNGNSPKSVELNRILIETVGRFPQPEATQVLLRRALMPDSIDMRAAAADELKKRPMHAYVPQLIAALPGSIKTQFRVFVGPNGTVVHEHEIFLEGRQANVSLTYESTVSPADAMTEMFITPVATARETRSAANIEARARQIQARSQWVRDRIQFVLQRTTGFANANDPQLWEKQYNDYNGWYTPSQTKPTYNVSASNYFSGIPYAVVFKSPHNCFPAGTLVTTMSGLHPIEDVKLGDRVLAQDVATGELAYKPVQLTTLRPPTPLVKIGLGSQFLLATPGHPFWVVGEGWRTAKHLKVGTLVHAMNGAILVESLEEIAPQEVYNFVVSEFHNYFVGESRLLVHDNSPIEETSSACPGLAIEKP